jgi:hypothetical protein
MSNADGSIPTTVTRRRRRRSGFRYSSKKALERSKLSKEKSKGRGLELGSARKALTYPCELLNEIGVVDLAECSPESFEQLTLPSLDEHHEASEIGNIVHQDCAPGSSHPSFADAVEEHDGDRVELSCGDAVTDNGCNLKVCNFHSLFLVLFLS